MPVEVTDILLFEIFHYRLSQVHFSSRSVIVLNCVESSIFFGSNSTPKFKSIEIKKHKLNLDFLKITQETQLEFEMIADKLFNNCAIENHESIFRFTEIEFYWTSPKYIDDSTYQRNHVDPKS